MASPQTDNQKQKAQKPPKSSDKADPKKQGGKGDPYQNVKDEEAEQIKDNPGAL